MQRRGGSGQPVKGQRHRTIRPKARKAPTAHVSNADLQEQLGRAMRERDEALEQQAATSEVLQVISRSAFDLKSVLQTLVESAARLCRADKAAITRQMGGEFFFTETYGLSPEFIEHVRNVPVKPERGTVSGVVLLEGRTIHVSDVRVPRNESWAKAQELGDFRTMLGVPMLREGTPIGILALVRTEVQPFTDKQIELVENFAAQAVIAIENARLLNELRQRTDDLSEALEQQTATSEVLKVISSSPGELEPVFNAMLGNAVRICGARFGNLWLREGDAFRISAMYGAPPAYADYLHKNPIFHPFPGTALGRTFSTKQAVQIPDARLENAYAEGSPLHVGTIALACARTIIAVPLLKDGELIGAIVIFRQEVRPFTEKQVELVRNFAAQAVIAIENARLLNELRESLQQQTATADVLKAISSLPGELESVFQTMLANAVRICEAKFGVLFSYRDSEFSASAWVDVPPAYEENLKRLGSFHPESGSITRRLVDTKKAVHVPDVTADRAYIERQPRIVTMVELAGFRSMLAVPMLKGGDQLIGAIFIYRQEISTFTDKQIELVKNFAAQAVIAIENARLLSELQVRDATLCALCSFQAPRTLAENKNVLVNIA